MRFVAFFLILTLSCGACDRASNPKPLAVASAQSNPRLPMLKPLHGRLSSHIFENKSLNIAPTVVFDIELPLEKFEFDGEETDTSVRMERIRFKVDGWRELAGREFRFPVNPESGYIDGSVYLGAAHNPADVTRIKFGELSGNRLSAEIDIQFDFEYEGLDELGKPRYTWRVTLDLDPEALDKVASDFKK